MVNASTERSVNNIDFWLECRIRRSEFGPFFVFFFQTAALLNPEEEEEEFILIFNQFHSN